MLELGLEIPTGELWQYAARAGQETAWWTGNDPGALDGAANLIDDSARDAQLPQAADQKLYFDDGFVAHAPVDLFRPNPFGLHNAIGNVSEWTRAYRKQLPSGQRQPPGSWEVEERYALCGGSFLTPVASSKLGHYTLATPDYRAPAIGVRPMRRLDRQ